MKKREQFKHKHPVNHHPWSIGQRIADKLATFAGSWIFILCLIAFIFLWVSINIYEFITKSFDPYPFIFLNLILAIITAILAPIILMSQNRSEQKDRLRAEYDYEVNLKAEKEVREIKEQLTRIEKRLK
jgi:uncharacterized membrane protein